MMMTRRFLIAPALARLIRNHCGSTPETEGFFEPQSDRSVFLRISGTEGRLVLSTARDHEDPEEIATGIPTEHAFALLETCAGKVVFERSSLTLTNGRELLVRRFNGLKAFSTVTVTFPDGDSAEGFVVPIWFGADVTDDEAFSNRGLAFGIPPIGEFSISDAALDAIMDLLETEPKPTRGGSAAESQSTPPSTAELSDETLSTPTADMARALASTAFDMGEDGGSDDAPEDRPRFGRGRPAARAA